MSIEVLEVGQPQLHHRQQAVAAGDEPRPVAEPVEQADGVVDAGGAFVLERCRNLHMTDLTSVAGSISLRPLRQRVNIELSDRLTC